MGVNKWVIKRLDDCPAIREVHWKSTISPPLSGVVNAIRCRYTYTSSLETVAIASRVIVVVGYRSEIICPLATASYPPHVVVVDAGPRAIGRAGALLARKYYIATFEYFTL
ncbi:hypothetical protein HAX54_047416 [Datura stramonium]|uniref:Uncharacterized protein n=1 Tax=Datura stramonium TaxID=4076 RepID=A0ABS8WK76_DATST|nr:hypothetical protein [Datura stramonium]